MIRTNLYINICCNIYEQKENVQSVSSSAVDLLYSELEKLDKINYAKAVCILSDFEDFMYLICEHVKYKDTMTMISIQERIQNDKNIRFVLENAVKRLKDSNINLKEIFDFLIDSAYGVSKFISLNFLEGVITSYMMLIASYMIKIKNNKFLGLVEKNGVFKVKYGNEQILSKDTLIKLSGIEDKIKFIFKNKVFTEFFNDFLKLPQSTISLDIVKDKKVVNKLGHGFEYEKDRYVLYCDIKNRDVKIYSRKVEEDSNGTRVLRDTYRTAFIRKLHTGWKISDEAKNNAERLGVILPEDYTFVREHIPVENKEIKRVVRVRE